VGPNEQDDRERFLSAAIDRISLYPEIFDRRRSKFSCVKAVFELVEAIVPSLLQAKSQYFMDFLSTTYPDLRDILYRMNQLVETGQTLCYHQFPGMRFNGLADKSRALLGFILALMYR
jgi:hypothetical protein